MTITTLTKNPRTLIVGGTSNSAGAATRGTQDLRTASGGILTIKLTNGSPGPSVQAEARVMIAHNSGATPTAGSAGANWKTIWTFGGSTSASTVTEQSITIDPAVMHLQVEVAGNTGQPVVCEAFLSELTSFTTS